MKRPPYLDVCVALMVLVSTAKSETLEEQIARGDYVAMLKAGTDSRKDLIPVLQKIAETPSTSSYDTRLASRMALSKLGVMTYLCDFVADLISTDCPQFQDLRRCERKIEYKDKSEKWWTTLKTLERLEYIHHKSTVKYIACLLYSTEPVPPHAIDCVLTPYPEMATHFLSRMDLENPPTNGTVTSWKEWWQQNQEKYP